MYSFELYMLQIHIIHQFAIFVPSYVFLAATAMRFINLLLVNIIIIFIFIFINWLIKCYKVVTSGAPFLSRDGRNHLRYSLHLPTEGRWGRVEDPPKVVTNSWLDVAELRWCDVRRHRFDKLVKYSLISQLKVSTKLTIETYVLLVLYFLRFYISSILHYLLLLLMSYFVKRLCSCLLVISGAGTNLKVGGGHRSGARAGIFFWSCPPHFRL